MSSFLAFGLLLVGAGGNGTGLSFHAQLGYEPAVLLRGKDFRKHVSDLTLLDASIVLYSSHSLRLKIGVQTHNGIGIRAIGSLGISAIGNPEPNLSIPTDSTGYWSFNHSTATSFEYNAGVEVGYTFEQLGKCWRQGGNFYAGFELVEGKLFEKESWTKRNLQDQWEGNYTFHVTSQVKGWQGHVGLGVPLCSFGRFDLQIQPMLKGGAVKEESTEFLDALPGTVWKGPRTLLKWGIALGLTLNYNGGKQK